MANTKSGFRGTTYAQNLCCGAARCSQPSSVRYQSNSAAKLLIYMASVKCFFLGHFKKTLDLQGLRVIVAKLSTKLSTENLKICKALLNQVLRAFSASAFGESSYSAEHAAAITP